MSADSVRIPTPAGGDGAAEADPDSPPALSRRLTSGMTLQAVPGTDPDPDPDPGPGSGPDLNLALTLTTDPNLALTLTWHDVAGRAHECCWHRGGPAAVRL